MNSIFPPAQNLWDEFCNIVLLILRDGARLADMTYGQYMMLIFGVLAPVALVSLITSASLALAGGRVPRRCAMVFLAIGLICTLTIVAALCYAMIAGQEWAFTSYK